MDEQRLQEIEAAPVVDLPYDPSCVECRRAAGKDLAGTTWQCVGHVYLERNSLREELALEKACRERNWTDLKWVRLALDNECRLSESLTAQRDAALAERDEARHQASVLSTAKEEIINALTAERDALQARIATFQQLVTRTRDELAANADIWQAQQDALVAERDEAREKADKLRDVLEGSNKNHARLIAERDTAGAAAYAEIMGMRAALTEARRVLRVLREVRAVLPAAGIPDYDDVIVRYTEDEWGALVVATAHVDAVLAQEEK